MKINILVLISMLTINLSLSSQVYVPFSTENVNWNVYLEKSEFESPTDTVLLRYTIHGDTIINDVLYNNLCLESGDLMNPTIRSIGGLREFEKRIYFIGEDFFGFPHDEELLLYDFNTQVNDTIYHDNYDTFYSVIEAIDSVKIDNAYRKRFKVNSNNNYNFEGQGYWIEGIGSVKNGLLGHITMIPTCCYIYWEHVCFKENEVVKYLNPSFSECFPNSWLTSITHFVKELEISLYPNPIDNELFIDNNTVLKELSLKIMDINSKVVVKKQGLENKMVLNFPFSSGVYAAIIIDKNGRIHKTEKIIKR